MKKKNKTSPSTAPAPGDPGTLCPQDQEHLASLEKKLQLVRDRTRAVALGYSTGFYLFGNGGVGKSYTVLNELEALQANFKVFNSRMTGRGLFNALEKYPDAVHVLEDMEQILRDKGAQGVLRSALWGQRKKGEQGPMERLVTWSTFRMEHKFTFTGGIIMIANRPLHDLPELDAVKTRIAYMHLQVSDVEIRALMRKLAMQGYEDGGRSLEPKVCQEVCEYLVGHSLGMHRTLDLRLLVTSFQDRLQWEENDSGCHWKDLVDSRVREWASRFREEVSLVPAADRKQQELQLVREIVAATADRHERFRLWAERSRKSEQTLYRLIKKVKEGT